jgi:hypothetical protein
MFCSEVVSRAYAYCGIRLWMGMSHISSPTTTAWLASLGVRNFETQEPSDLEYDPQLEVAGEWISARNLFRAHLDDAVTDTMFEEATAGAPLPYNQWLLPFSRLAKGYSSLLNVFGIIGPVPEGMSATVALRVSCFQKEHELRKERLAGKAAEFQSHNGYVAPFWELLKIAKAESPARTR